MRALLLAALTIALQAACASGVGAGRADVLRPGAVEVGVAGEAALGLLKRGPGRPVPLPSYALGAQARAGVIDGVDVGGRAWGGLVPGMSNVGVAGDAKLQFLGLRRARGWDGAVALALVYDRLDVGGAVSESYGVTVPILFGIATDTRPRPAQFTFGPRFSAQVMLAESSVPQTLGFLGGSVGYAFAIAEQWELRPELVVQYSPVHWNGLVEARDRRGLTLIELGVSVVWLR